MMVALLLYAYSRGRLFLAADRQGCEERLDIMAVTGMQRPDFRTISDSASAIWRPWASCSCRCCGCAAQAGLVKLGHVALDGTKSRPTPASTRRCPTAGCSGPRPELAAEVQGWLAQAEAADAAEDAEHGPDRRGDELPDWVADKQQRLERIRAAKAALEAEAAADPPAADAEPGPSVLGMMDLAGRRGRRTAVRRRGRSATSPIPTAACSRPGTASSRATTASSRSTRRTRSSWPSA